MSDVEGGICRATLVAEGSSDRVLLPLIERLLDVHCRRPYHTEFADSMQAGGHDALAKILDASQRFPCEVLFVHRDADACTPQEREQEIRDAHAGISLPPHLICVIPVRETEAWLLVDADAIRAAACNPNGRHDLSLPALKHVQSIPDPKAALFNALRHASGLPAQRLRKFSPEACRRRVSELMTGLDRLRELSSFAHLERQIEAYFQGAHRGVS